MKLEQVGVQLYTLRSLTETDMLGTLRQLAEIGYRGVELAGFGNSTAGEIRATLDELGMRAIAAHIRIDRLEQEADAVLDELQTLGCEYAVVPWIGEGERSSLEAVRSLAARLNRIGQQFQASGIRLAYHNHQFEFAPLDNTTMWHTLVAETDPALVDFELDLYWVVVGGYDPVELLQQYGERITLAHLKDRSHGPDGTFAPVGTGSLPFPAIIAAAQQTRWFIVEQDTSDAPLDDVRTSFRNVQQLVTAV
ncbi:MAG: sugar phosphate isomerase/epimerase [Chloroflexota bacterium]|nr:sugar phosphate isomerase/epimerase [Chloroflexota bacterium]